MFVSPKSNLASVFEDKFLEGIEDTNKRSVIRKRLNSMENELDREVQIISKRISDMNLEMGADINDVELKSLLREAFSNVINSLR